jgi:hypothetical protein
MSANCHHCGKEREAAEVVVEGSDVIRTCPRCLTRTRHRKNLQAAPDLGIVPLTCPELTIKGDP